MAENSANAISSTAGGAAAGGSVGGPWGAVAGGALGLAGSVFGANSAKSASKASDKAALLSTLMQIDWEKKRAQNAHQWEVADLHAAGLNPILSAGGQGANTGGISPAMPDTSGLKSAGEIMSKGLENIIPIATNVYSGLKSTENQTTETETNKTLKQAEAAKIIAETKQLPQKMKSEIYRNIAEAGRTKELGKTQEKYNKALNFGEESGKNIADKIGEKLANAITSFDTSWKNKKRKTRLKNSWSARQISLKQ